MSGERRVFDKEFKLISVELNGPPRGNSRTDFSALAKEIGYSTGNVISLAQRVFRKTEWLFFREW